MKRNIRSLLAAVLLCAVLCSGLICPAYAQGDKAAPAALIPGGYPFGVKFTTRGVLVVGFRDITTADGQVKNPAKDAGMLLKDVILSG